MWRARPLPSAPVPIVRSARVLGVLTAAGALLAGCGGSIDAHSGSTDVYDPRDGRLACLVEAGLPARKAPPNAIQVGDRGPRIVFATTAGEAEAIAVGGRAQGAEQIGRALLFVRGAPEDVLGTIEGCLDD